MLPRVLHFKREIHLPAFAGMTNRGGNDPTLSLRLGQGSRWGGRTAFAPTAVSPLRRRGSIAITLDSRSRE